MDEVNTPVWIKYAGDIFFLILFLVVFFFFKPQSDSDDETTEDMDSSEEPNPLEKVLRNDKPASEDDNPDEN